MLALISWWGVVFARFSSVKLPFISPSLYCTLWKKLPTHRPRLRNGKRCSPSLGWGSSTSRRQALWDARARCSQQEAFSLLRRGWAAPLSSECLCTPLHPSSLENPKVQGSRSISMSLWAHFGQSQVTPPPGNQIDDADKILTKVSKYGL